MDSFWVVTYVESQRHLTYWWGWNLPTITLVLTFFIIHLFTLLVVLYESASRALMRSKRRWPTLPALALSLVLYLGLISVNYECSLNVLGSRFICSLGDGLYRLSFIIGVLVVITYISIVVTPVPFKQVVRQFYRTERRKGFDLFLALPLVVHFSLLISFLVFLGLILIRFLAFESSYYQVDGACWVVFFGNLSLFVWRDLMLSACVSLLSPKKKVDGRFMSLFVIFWVLLPQAALVSPVLSYFVFPSTSLVTTVSLLLWCGVLIILGLRGAKQGAFPTERDNR